MLNFHQLLSFKLSPWLRDLLLLQCLSGIISLHCYLSYLRLSDGFFYFHYITAHTELKQQATAKTDLLPKLSNFHPKLLPSPCRHPNELWLESSSKPWIRPWQEVFHCWKCSTYLGITFLCSGVIGSGGVGHPHSLWRALGLSSAPQEGFVSTWSNFCISAVLERFQRTLY